MSGSKRHAAPGSRAGAGASMPGAAGAHTRPTAPPPAPQAPPRPAPPTLHDQVGHGDLVGLAHAVRARNRLLLEAAGPGGGGGLAGWDWWGGRGARSGQRRPLGRPPRTPCSQSPPQDRASPGVEHRLQQHHVAPRLQVQPCAGHAVGQQEDHRGRVVLEGLGGMGGGGESGQPGEAHLGLWYGSVGQLEHAFQAARAAVAAAAAVGQQPPGPAPPGWPCRTRPGRPPACGGPGPPPRAAQL